MYTDGLGVRQDYARALEWFEKSAAGGSVDGLYNLGIFYLYGWGVKADRTMAKQYLAAASALGDAASEDALQRLMAEEKDAELQQRMQQERLVIERTQRRDAPVIVLESIPGEEPAALNASSEEYYQNHLDKSITSENTSDNTQPTIIHDEAWILDQDPQDFTIQVMALDSLQRLRQLLEGHEDLAPFAIYRLENNGRPLFVLVQGVYRDADAARAARDVFPRRLQRPAQVWIRRFEMVQRLIRAEEGD